MLDSLAMAEQAVLVAQVQQVQEQILLQPVAAAAQIYRNRKPSYTFLSNEMIF
jgi:hypothetical protein